MVNKVDCRKGSYEYKKSPRGINDPGWEFHNRRLRNSISILDYIIDVDDNLDEYILRQPPVHQMLCVLEDII